LEKRKGHGGGGRLTDSKTENATGMKDWEEHGQRLTKRNNRTRLAKEGKIGGKGCKDTREN